MKNNIMLGQLKRQQKEATVVKHDKKEARSSTTLSRKGEIEECSFEEDEVELESIYNFIREVLEHEMPAGALTLLRDTPFFKCLSEQQLTQRIRGQ
jgi:hypothetical protein